MKNTKTILPCISIVFMLLIACSKDDDSQQIIAQDTTIVSVSINGIKGVVNDNVIQVEIPIGTDVSALVPVIIHKGADIAPSTPQDFTTPVTYTVTAAGGNTQEWVIAVNFTKQTAQGSEFITTWDASEITIPINPNFTYNYNVDWDNDGIVDQTGITEGITHRFDTPGKHTIRISGVFPAIQFSYKSDEDDRLKIISLDQWGTGEWKSMKEAFKYCENLKISATDIPDLTNVTDMSAMFYHAYSANPDVSSWNTSNVTNISNMFYHADIARPDVSKWDVSNVTDMKGVFWSTYNANPDVSKWNVSRVTDMKLMFFGAVSANPDVSKWNVSNVTDMSGMFSLTSVAIPDVTNWDVSNVVDMKFMFKGAFLANPDVGKWNISKVIDMSDMFLGVTSFSTENYEKLLINFANQPHQNNVSFSAGSSVVNSLKALAARQNLLDDGWKIVDGSTP